ncbi:semaphorin-4E-like isoform X2 [Poeciliopsis prolifica]|uniref:semaphorin-4E-like isoform X2 n=1 Tax=Poeciliopsis prolifica TaxID=188132 RepID=UPI002413BC92|nr:semaphorin-4E-like isoform X2 [Poeciliopsis prolifica]
MMKSQVALLYVLIIMSGGLAQSLKPRRSVFFSDVNLKLFKEPDFDSLSSLLVREDIGLLFIGARGKVIMLRLDDITEKTGEMVYKGNVTMENINDKGRWKVPSNPEEKFASMLDGSDLYTAASTKPHGQKVLFQRHGENSMKNEEELFLSSKPNMISIHLAELSKSSEDHEDDNVILFFIENSFEDPRQLQVSRVARVCKSDIGGRSILRNKWTSYLEVSVDCPFGDIGSPSLLQDIFFLRDENNLMNSIFYATFTLNTEPSSTCNQTAVCAYKLSDIRQVFKGNYMATTSSGHWQKYTGEFRSPYPQSCINDEMRQSNIRTSRDFEDIVHRFAKHHPLMEGAVKPITGRPLLVRSAAQFSRIVVDKVTSLDGQQHNVMFISNNSGWLQKAVWSGDDGGRIIEELQLFQDPQPIRFLQLSSRSGQLYSATRTAVAQLSVRDCSRYTSCADCLTARDPYCGWDRLRGLCAAVAGASNLSMIQNLTDGDVGICPNSHWSKIIDIHTTVDVAQFLPCSPDTNLPISWSFSGNILEPGPRHILLSQGLVLTPSFTDEGLYTCETVEVVKGREHRMAVILYNIKVSEGGGNWFQAIIIYILACVCVLCVMFIIYVCWKQKARNLVGSSSESDDTTDLTGSSSKSDDTTVAVRVMIPLQPELKTEPCHCGNSGPKNQDNSSGSGTDKTKSTGRKRGQNLLFKTDL